MARFQMSVVYAKQKDSLETYSEEYDYTCFVNDKDDIPEIQQTVSEIVDQEIGSSEDEILFGSATVEIAEGHVMVMNFKNENYDDEEMDEIMDLIIAPEETMH